MAKRIGMVCVAVLLLSLTACGQDIQMAEGPEITAAPIITEIVEATAPPEKMAKVSIAEIDMATPENGKYRDWLEGYYTGARAERIECPPFPEPTTQKKTGRPDNTAFRAWRRRTWGRSLLAFAKDSWGTWDWNGTWELELYHYGVGIIGWDVLRARNKTTGETQFIHETFSHNGFDGAYSTPWPLRILDDTHLLYEVSGYDISSVHLFALGQGSVPITKNDYADWFFADEDYTRLYWSEREHDTMAFYCVDLLKMAAGESGVMKISGEHQQGQLNAFHSQPSPDGRYLCADAMDEEGLWLVLYDLVAGYEVYFGERPKMPSTNSLGIGLMAWADDSTIYLWEHVYSYDREDKLFHTSDSGDRTIDQIILFEICIEFA